MNKASVTNGATASRTTSHGSPGVKQRKWVRISKDDNDQSSQFKKLMHTSNEFSNPTHTHMYANPCEQAKISKAARGKKLTCTEAAMNYRDS